MQDREWDIFDDSTWSEEERAEVEEYERQVEEQMIRDYEENHRLDPTYPDLM